MYLSGHDSTSDCVEDCPKIELEQYLKENADIKESISINNQYAPTYLTSVGQKIDSFIRNIVQCGGSPLYAKEYFFIPKFSPDGTCIVQGVIWPSFVRAINLQRLQPVITTEENDVLRQELLSDIEKSVTCSSSFQDLKTQFHLDDTDTRKVVHLVKENQVDLEDDSNPTMPALITISCEVPKHSENIVTSRRLLKFIKWHLINLTKEQRSMMSTFEFLDSLYEDVDQSDQTEDRWKLVFCNETFIFKMESKIFDYMDQFSNIFLGPLYHFALWCVPADRNWEVILKKTHISDCFTKPFSPLILKTFKNTVYVTTSSGNPDWKLLHPRWMGDSANLHVSGHEEMSLNEALALSDGRKCRIRSSRPFEFVFSGPTKKVLLKRIEAFEAGNENIYQLQGEVGHYELQNSAVSRYFGRINGRKMMLCEFAVHYEFVGKEESDKLYKLYIDRIEDIPLSTDKSVIEEAEFPEYIIVSNKDVMKKRTRSKILNYPYYDGDSYDYKHSKVLLYFYPVELEDLKEATVNNLYNSTIVDEIGNEALKVKNNEKLFLKRFRQQL